VIARLMIFSLALPEGLGNIAVRESVSLFGRPPVRFRGLAKKSKLWARNIKRIIYKRLT
jgi:hypothetical protein